MYYKTSITDRILNKCDDIEAIASFILLKCTPKSYKLNMIKKLGLDCDIDNKSIDPQTFLN